MDCSKQILRLRRVKNILPSRKEAMDYIETERKSHYGEPIVARYRGENDRIYTILAIGSSEYSNKNPNNRYQYIDTGLIEKNLKEESDERVASDESIIAAVGLAEGGSHARSQGVHTSGRTVNSIEDEIMALDAAVTAVEDSVGDESEERKAWDEKIVKSVGLAEDGSFKSAGKYTTKDSTTVLGALKDLDGKTHEIDLVIGKDSDSETKSTIHGKINKLAKVTGDRDFEIEKTLEFEDGKYVPFTSEDGTRFINEQNSIRDEIRALDFVLQKISDTVSEIHEDIKKIMINAGESPVL